MTALWIILFIIGVPIVVAFWIVVALIISVAHDNKKKSKRTRTRRLTSLANPNKAAKRHGRRAKQTIMKLR